MRKVVLAAAVLLLIFAAPAFANELELGLSWTPLPGADKNAEEGQLDSITGFHIAYNWWSIMYASWDSLVMPPFIIQDWTGYRRPGFLNLYDVGIRIVLGPVVGYATLGMNNVYVYKQKELAGLENNFGANLRLGAGLKFNWWGINLSGTAVFPSFQYMVNTLKGLAAKSTSDVALSKIGDALVPSINVTFYF
jgi:hypothetical protein